MLTPSRLLRAANCLVTEQFAVRKGESVLITADTETEKLLLDVVVNRVVQLGAKPLVALAPRLPFQGGLSDPYVSDSLKAAAASSDVWLDFCFPYHAGSGAHAAAMTASRCRYGLIATSSAASLERLYGAVDYSALLDFNLGFMEFVGQAAGETVRFTCPAGTDVSFKLAELKLTRSRVKDSPGMDTVPGAQSLYPVLDSVRGKIVIQSLFDEHYRRLRLPITIHAQGIIGELTGGSSEDRLSFERALKRASGKGEYGYFVHFTLGFHPGAKLAGKHFIEDIRAPGTNAIGMGLPWWEEGGGENHPDGVVFDQSLWVGDIQVTDQGYFVGPPRLKKLYDSMSRRMD